MTTEAGRALLRRLAKAATPGPWREEQAYGGWWVVAPTLDYPVHPHGQPHPLGAVVGGKSIRAAASDAAYIAAASPDVILRLLDEVQEARSRALAEVRARVEGLPTFPRDGAAGPISMVARAAVLVAIDAAAKDGTWMTTGSAAIEEVSRRG